MGYYETIYQEIQERHKLLNDRYASVLGARTEEGPYKYKCEYAGCNDLGYPYFHKYHIKSKRTGKKCFYTQYQREWLQGEWEKTRECLRYMNE